MAQYPWFTSLPLAEGWYVFQYNASFQDPPLLKTICVQVLEEYGVLCVVPENDDPEAHLLTDFCEGRWKGHLDLENL